MKIKHFLCLFGLFFVIFVPQIGTSADEPRPELWTLSNGIQIKAQDLLKFNGMDVSQMLEEISKEADVIAVPFRVEEANVPEKFRVTDPEIKSSWTIRMLMFHVQLETLYGVFFPVGDMWDYNKGEKSLFVFDWHLKRSEIIHEYIHHLINLEKTGGRGFFVTEKDEKISFQKKRYRDDLENYTNLTISGDPSVGQFWEQSGRRNKIDKYEEEIAVYSLVIEKASLLGVSQEELESSHIPHLIYFQKKLRELNQ